VGDSIEGWADAIKILMKSYFFGKSTVVFDYSDIRPKGALLVTSGGKAPGHEPLAACIEQIRTLLETKKMVRNWNQLKFMILFVILLMLF
jgi:ribonucleoside-triphosphate reductase